MNIPAAAHPTSAQLQPLAEQVWQWLGEVSDPEIPVISVVDLGIVRGVELISGNGNGNGDGNRDVGCIVTITPTYSGCPAMGVIADEIRAALLGHGLASVEIRTRLAPAWNTDWMSEHGKQQLKGYGIAPPAQQVIDIRSISRRQPAPQVACPHCGSLHTVCVSQFGSTSCKALYQCKDCMEPFDYFKAH